MLFKPKKNLKSRRPRTSRKLKIPAKFNMSKDADIDYKNFALLQKYLTDRGKVLPRRVTGITSKEQRKLSIAIKRARFLALLPSGGVQE